VKRPRAMYDLEVNEEVANFDTEHWAAGVAA